MRFSALAERAAQNRPGAAAVRPPVHMGAGIRQALWHQDSRRHVGTCWRLRRHANPCQSVRVSPATMPDGVRPAAEAISASEDALMLDSEAAAIMSSLSSGAASNECLLITPMSAADSSAAPVVGTMTVTIERGAPVGDGGLRWRKHEGCRRRDGEEHCGPQRHRRPIPPLTDAPPQCALLMSTL